MKTLRNDPSKLETGTYKRGAKDVVDKVKNDNRLIKEEAPEAREMVEMEGLEEVGDELGDPGDAGDQL